MFKTQVRSLGWEDPLEKEMATHSSILAWTEKPGGLQSMGLQRVGHDLTIKPLPLLCLYYFFLANWQGYHDLFQIRRLLITLFTDHLKTDQDRLQVVLRNAQLDKAKPGSAICLKSLGLLKTEPLINEQNQPLFQR